jgi:CRP-like cAMP-binding protein
MEENTDLPETKLRLFYDGHPAIKYKRGSQILVADENPEGMYYITEGFVAQYAKNAQGQVLFLHIYKPGSCFPLMWLFNTTPNRYSYEAVTEVELKRASTEDVKDFFNRHTDILEYFMSKILLGLDGLLARMESLVLDTAYTKTVLLFWYLTKTFGIKKEGTTIIDMPLNHQQISSWIGTARETASLQVETLRSKGILEYEGKRYRVKNIALLDGEVDKIKAA